MAAHALGLALVLTRVGRHRGRPPTRLGPVTRLLVEVAFLLLLIHFVEICAWALFYRWAGCLQVAESAFYFRG